MKKAFLIGSAIFMVLLMTACGDLLTPPATEEAANILYTTDGRRLVNLTFGGEENNFRALRLDTAKAGTNFYEVVFVNADENEFYRTSWKEGQTARLAVPAGTYDNDVGTNGQAYMFAGYADDKTLLAIGTLKNVYNSNAPTTAVTDKKITEDTIKVEFELEALENNVNSDSNTSTFQITDVDGTDYTGTPLYATFPVIKDDDGKSVPVFLLPQTKTLAGEVTEVTATYGITNTLLNIAKIKAEPTIVHKPYLWKDAEGNVGMKDVKDVTFTNNITPDGDLTLPITMTIEVPSTEDATTTGLCRFYFEIPVYMLDTDVTSGFGTTKDAQTWYIRGGLLNSILDDGSDDDKQGLGGAILLGIGTDALVNAPGGMIISDGQP